MCSAGLPPPTPRYPSKLEQVTDLCFRWILDAQFPAQDQDTSITTVLTSQPLAACLSQHIDPTTVITFRHFLLSATLAHTGWRDQRPPPHRLSTSALHRLSCATGSALLQRLDALALTSSHQDRAGNEDDEDEEPLSSFSSSITSSSRATSKLQAHFVLTLGTALGVAYSTRKPSPSSGACLDPAHRCSPTQWLATRDRLRGLLARELVALGGALEPDMGPDAQAGLERAATGQWGTRHERWAWGNALLPSVGPTTYGPAHGLPGEATETAGGMFCPVPCVAMIAQPEALGTGFPMPGASDERKRRSMIVVGPSDGQQVYARVRMHGNSGGPKMMV